MPRRSIPILLRFLPTKAYSYGVPDAATWLYNVCMDRPVDYGEVAAYLKKTRGLDAIDILSAHHSNWMDNSKARFRLGWRPVYDLEKLIDSAWDYTRASDDLRKVWYPG